MRRALGLAAAAAIAACVAGCSQPGTTVPYPGEAAKIGVATQRIAVACGYAYQLRAFGGAHPHGLQGVGSIAVSGARKLAHAYSRYQSELFEGESVGAVVHDSISLLEGCGLPRAKRVLTQALARQR
jgi:hypothetical protein